MKLRALLVLGFAAALAGCQKDPTEELGYKQPNELVKLMFESQDPDMRRGAICELSKHSYGLSESYLKGYAMLAGKDPDGTVRSAAMRALAAGKDARFIEPVVANLRHADATVRWDAAAALDVLVDEQALAGLCGRANTDSSVEVRSAAALALRHYSRQQAAECLLRAMDDAEFSVRFTAREALKQITGQDAGNESKAWRPVVAQKFATSQPASSPAGAPIKL